MVSCSDENLNHKQSKYVPHHVNNNAKIGHLNTRRLYPKIVSETWLPEYIKNDELRIPGYIVFRSCNYIYVKKDHAC